MLRSLLIVAGGLALLSACGEGTLETPVGETTTTATIAQPATTSLPPRPLTTVTSIPAEVATPPVEPAPESDVSRGVRLFWPSADQATSGLPLLVLVPGGGWVSADPAGLEPLAETLTASGAIVATITYRTASDGAYFPTPVEDVACAAAYAASAIHAEGVAPSEVIIVGHSAGAQLGALVALRPTDFSAQCDHPPLSPDGFVGLAGPYDVVLARSVAIDLFGPGETDPTEWSDGNPVDHTARRPALDVLLIHGESDQTVPIRFTHSFAAALTSDGHNVDTAYPDAADHHTVYSPEVAAPLISEWLKR